MSRLLRMVLASAALIAAMLLHDLAAAVESGWAYVAVTLGMWLAVATAVQLIVSAARSAARAAAHETDEALLRRYVAYRDEMDRADRRAES